MTQSQRQEVIRSIRRLRRVIAKMTPDEFREKHGRCPIGYHFEDDRCTPVTHTIKKKAAEKGADIKKGAAASKEKTKEFLRTASGVQKQFFADREFRKSAMTSMAASVRKSPKEFAKRLVSVAKEEVHEFKEAGKGLMSFVRGKKLSDHEKKAIRKVATHLAISTAAAAATASGLGIAAGVAKALGKSVVLKAVAPVLEKLHLGEEITHITHLFSHSNDDLMQRLSKAKTEDEAMEILGEEIAQATAAALEGADLSSQELFNIAKSGSEA